MIKIFLSKAPFIDDEKNSGEEALLRTMMFPSNSVLTLYPNCTRLVYVKHRTEVSRYLAIYPVNCYANDIDTTLAHSATTIAKLAGANYHAIPKEDGYYNLSARVIGTLPEEDGYYALSVMRVGTETYYILTSLLITDPNADWDEIEHEYDTVSKGLFTETTSYVFCMVK